VAEYVLYPGMLVASLLVIIGACGLFTNGVEWTGKRMDLSHGATGSLLAAVGTALPETIVPVIALMSGKGGPDVAVGAIAGSPFMLSTLAMFVSGGAYYFSRAGGGRDTSFAPEPSALTRDLGFFICIYLAAVLATFLPSGPARYALALGLAGAYIYYAKVTLSHEGEMAGKLDGLILSKVTGAGNNNGLIALQVLLGLMLIASGAHFFVLALKKVSLMAGVPPVILSLLLAPVATELPEMLNSTKWIRAGKDTLALGNVTGALVFQASFPVAIGVAFTPWELDGTTMVSALCALGMAGMMYAWVTARRSLPPYVLLAGGLSYAAFVVYVFAG
jgi:cation:H+ antiporter